MLYNMLIYLLHVCSYATVLVRIAIILCIMLHFLSGSLPYIFQFIMCIPLYISTLCHNFSHNSPISLYICSLSCYASPSGWGGACYALVGLVAPNLAGSYWYCNLESWLRNICNCITVTCVHYVILCNMYYCYAILRNSYVTWLLIVYYVTLLLYHNLDNKRRSSSGHIVPQISDFHPFAIPLSLPSNLASVLT